MKQMKYIEDKFEKLTQFSKHKKMTSATLKSENFKFISHIHDWRNYVDEDFKKIWKDLTDGERKIIFIFCQEKSDAEEWD